jgi:chitinase
MNKILSILLSLTLITLIAVPGTSAATRTDIPVSSVKNVTFAPKLIYAYWPHQTDPSSYQPDWKEISIVADLSVDAKSNGNLTTPDINKYNTVKNLARQNGVKVILPVAIHNFDKDTMDNIFAFHREDLANNISHALQTYGADGVDIDFEHPRNINKYTNESNKNLVEELMRTLYTKLKSKNQNYYIILNVAGSSVEEVYQNPALSQYIDFVFLRGYNYHFRNSNKTGASSPYNDIINSVNLLKNNYSQNKIILGLFFFGYDWPSASSEPGANTIGSGFEIPMKDAIDNASIYGRLWDSNSRTPWYNYTSGGAWHQTWYDDDDSLGLKFDIVNSENIRGAGFWALGAEGNNASIWKVVREKIVIEPRSTSTVLPTAEPTGAPKSPGFGLVASLAALLTWGFMARQRNK